MGKVGATGFCIVSDFQRPARELVEALGELRTPLVSDAMGRFQVMDAAIKPIITNQRVVGPAFTVKLPLMIT